MATTIMAPEKLLPDKWCWLRDTSLLLVFSLRIWVNRLWSHCSGMGGGWLRMAPALIHTWRGRGRRGEGKLNRQSELTMVMLQRIDQRDVRLRHKSSPINPPSHPRSRVLEDSETGTECQAATVDKHTKRAFIQQKHACAALTNDKPASLIPCASRKNYYFNYEKPFFFSRHSGFKVTVGNLSSKLYPVLIVNVFGCYSHNRAQFK